MERDSTPEADYNLLRQLWQSMKHRPPAGSNRGDCLPDLAYGFWHAGNTLDTFADYLSRADIPYPKAIAAELADDGIDIFREAIGVDLREKLPAKLNEQAWWDDYGWWGLAFLKVHALTGSDTYLDCAEKCWVFMMSGRVYSSAEEGSLGGTWNHNPAGDGIQNIITNALFLSLSAQLYLRVKASNPEYRTQARAQYEWFRYWFEHGALRSVALGKLITPIDNYPVQQSQAWGDGYWTGSQGALIGGLQAMNQLAKVAGDPALGEATAMYGDAIASAAIRSDELTRKRNGAAVLFEPSWRDLNGATGKGVLMRYLVGWLHYRGQLGNHAQFIRDNANAVATTPSTDEYAAMSWAGDINERISANSYPKTDALTRQCSGMDAQNALLLL
jgi:Glycosyl hydrolase family 76